MSKTKSLCRSCYKFISGKLLELLFRVSTLFQLKNEFVNEIFLTCQRNVDFQVQHCLSNILDSLGLKNSQNIPEQQNVVQDLNKSADVEVLSSSPVVQDLNNPPDIQDVNNSPIVQALNDSSVRQNSSDIQDLNNLAIVQDQNNSPAILDPNNSPDVQDPNCLMDEQDLNKLVVNVDPMNCVAVSSGSVLQINLQQCYPHLTDQGDVSNKIVELEGNSESINIESHSTTSCHDHYQPDNMDNADKTNLDSKLSDSISVKFSEISERVETSDELNNKIIENRLRCDQEKSAALEIDEGRKDFDTEKEKVPPNTKKVEDFLDVQEEKVPLNTEMDRKPIDIKEEQIPRMEEKVHEMEGKVPHDTMIEREPVEIKEGEVPHDNMIEREPVDIQEGEVPNDTEKGRDPTEVPEELVPCDSQKEREGLALLDSKKERELIVISEGRVICDKEKAMECVDIQTAQEQGTFLPKTLDKLNICHTESTELNFQTEKSEIFSLDRNEDLVSSSENIVVCSSSTICDKDITTELSETVESNDVVSYELAGVVQTGVEYSEEDTEKKVQDTFVGVCVDHSLINVGNEITNVPGRFNNSIRNKTGEMYFEDHTETSKLTKNKADDAYAVDFTSCVEGNVSIDDKIGDAIPRKASNLVEIEENVVEFADHTRISETDESSVDRSSAEGYIDNVKINENLIENQLVNICPPSHSEMVLIYANVELATFTETVDLSNNDSLDLLASSTEVCKLSESNSTRGDLLENVRPESEIVPDQSSEPLESTTNSDPCGPLKKEIQLGDCRIDPDVDKQSSNKALTFDLSETSELLGQNIEKSGDEDLSSSPDHNSSLISEVYENSLKISEKEVLTSHSVLDRIDIVGNPATNKENTAENVSTGNSSSGHLNDGNVDESEHDNPETTECIDEEFDLINEALNFLDENIDICAVGMSESLQGELTMVVHDVPAVPVPTPSPLIETKALGYGRNPEEDMCDNEPTDNPKTLDTFDYPLNEISKMFIKEVMQNAVSSIRANKRPYDAGDDYNAEIDGSSSYREKGDWSDQTLEKVCGRVFVCSAVVPFCCRFCFLFVLMSF